MIDWLTARLPGVSVDASLDGARHGSTDEDGVEIGFDQHYGLRITIRGQWTEIQFREADTWSAPIDTRELVRSRMRG